MYIFFKLFLCSLFLYIGFSDLIPNRKNIKVPRDIIIAVNSFNERNEFLKGECLQFFRPMFSLLIIIHKQPT